MDSSQLNWIANFIGELQQNYNNPVIKQGLQSVLASDNLELTAILTAHPGLTRAVTSLIESWPGLDDFERQQLLNKWF